MRRTTLLLLLATTTTCYGQSNADIPADQAPSGSSYIDEDRPRIEQSNEENEPSRENIERVEQGSEEAGRVERSNEETERVEQNNAEVERFPRIRQDEEHEALRRQQQPENTLSAPLRQSRQYKQNEHTSVPRSGHAGNSKSTYRTTTTPASHKRSHDSSNKSYNQP